MPDLHGEQDAPHGGPSPDQRFEAEATRIVDKLNATLPATPAPAAKQEEVSPPPGTPGKALPTPASAPEKVEAPALAPHLLARAAEHGMTEAEALELGDGLERHLNHVDRALAKAYRASQQQHAQQPQQPASEKPKEPESWYKPDWWKTEDGEVDPAIVKQVDAMKTHFEGVIGKMSEKLEQAYSYISNQAAISHEQTIHTLADKLAEQGYSELGSGRVLPGTAQYEARVKLNHVIQKNLEAMDAAGIRPTGWDQVAQAAAVLLYGVRQPNAAAPAAGQPQPSPSPGREMPPRDPITGKFQPTSLRPPTKQEPGPAQGVAAAIEEVSRQMANGSLKDIHEM